jgi:hypothetical protein
MQGGKFAHGESEKLPRNDAILSREESLALISAEAKPRCEAELNRSSAATAGPRLRHLPLWIYDVTDRAKQTPHP